MNSIFFKAGAAVATGVAAVALAAAPASAAGANAYNLTTEYLTSSTQSGMSSTCFSRSIYLGADTYYWDQNQWTPGPGVPGTPLVWGGTSGEQIYLAAGTYTWTDCLTPISGVPNYAEQSSLTPTSFPGATAYMNDTVYVANSGSYTWGSELSPY